MNQKDTNASEPQFDMIWSRTWMLTIMCWFYSWANSTIELYLVLYKIWFAPYRVKGIPISTCLALDKEAEGTIFNVFVCDRNFTFNPLKWLLTHAIKVVQFQSVTQVKDHPSKFKLISSWLNLRDKKEMLRHYSRVKRILFS